MAAQGLKCSFGSVATGTPNFALTLHKELAPADTQMGTVTIAGQTTAGNAV